PPRTLICSQSDTQRNPAPDQTQNGRPVPNPALAFTSYHATGPGWGLNALQGIKRKTHGPPSTSVAN
ncbi:hypothetical protein JOQ06_018339, partial [Pogonophryne albipinna]